LKLRARSGHLVAPFDRRTRREIAASERLDARLQPLEPPREARHERPRPEAHREREERQRRNEPCDVLEVRLARGHQPAPVGQPHAEQQMAADARPVPAGPALRRQRQRPAHPGDELPARPVDRGVDAEARAEPVERRLQLRDGALGPGQQLDRGIGDRLRESPLLAQARRVPPGGARENREEREHRDDGQVDLRAEPAHQSSSCLRAKT
jgi:hypothetical protein